MNTSGAMEKLKKYFEDLLGIELSDDDARAALALSEEGHDEDLDDAELALSADSHPADAYEFDLKGSELQRFNTLHPRNPEGTFKTKGNGGSDDSGERSSGERSSGTGSPSSKPGERIGAKGREANRDVNRDVLDAALKRNPALVPYRKEILAAYRAVKNGAPVHNAQVTKIPLRLRGEAKDVVAALLRDEGYKIRYQKYEDGSRAPVAVEASDGTPVSPVELAAISSAKWDGSASRYTDEQYKRACLVVGEGKSDSKLPVREPSGALNTNALKAARAALSGARGGVSLTEEQKKSALAKLKRLYSRAGLEFSENGASEDGSDDGYLDVALAAKDVTPESKRKLKGILAHYRDKEHPFSACVADNTKRFGKDGAEKLCATLKDLIEGDTKWRGKDKAKASEALSEAELAAFAVEIPEGFSEYLDAAYDALDLAGSEADEAYALAQGMGRTNYKTEAWVRATILHLEPKYGETYDTTKHQLPIRKPDGSLSLEAMKEAEKKLMTLDSVPAEKRREAARELVREYRNVNENPSDALKGLAGEMYYRDFSTGQEVMFTGAESVLLPVVESDSAHSESVELADAEGKKRKLFWKDLLPVDATIGYSGGTGKLRSISFPKKDLEQAVKNFKAKALGAVPFVMVKDNNAHSDAPELARGIVKDMRIKGKHLQALIEPRTAEAESFLKNFPELGISAKYHPNFSREDTGKRYGPTILHAAATWRPHIGGMGLWQAVRKAGAALSDGDPGDEALAYAFSNDEEVLLDLTGERFEETSEPGGDLRNASEGNEQQRGGAMKVEIRDGKVVFLSDDGEVMELSEEDRKKYAEAFGVDLSDDDGPTVAELSERLRKSETERLRDKIAGRIERDYTLAGIDPAFGERLLQPALYAAVELGDAAPQVEVVELSTQDGKPVERRHKVNLEQHLWNLGEFIRENIERFEFAGERGDSGATGREEANSDTERDRKVKERMKEANLSYADAAVALSQEGLI